MFIRAWLGKRYRTLWSELPRPQYGGLSVADVLELEWATDGLRRLREACGTGIQHLLGQRRAQPLLGALRVRWLVGQQPFVSGSD